MRESILANVREFKQVPGMEKITIEQVTAAIAALVTPNTSYDN